MRGILVLSIILLVITGCSASFTTSSEDVCIESMQEVKDEAIKGMREIRVLAFEAGFKSGKQEGFVQALMCVKLNSVSKCSQIL